jgi:hypothetical protein
MMRQVTVSSPQSEEDGVATAFLLHHLREWLRPSQVGTGSTARFTQHDSLVDFVMVQEFEDSVTYNTYKRPQTMHI